MPGRQQIPSFQIASGTANERDNSYNIPTGSIFFNTDTSNIELSGNVVMNGDVSFASFQDLSGRIVSDGFYAYLIDTGGATVSDIIPVGGKLYFPFASTSSNTGVPFSVGGSLSNANNETNFTVATSGYYQVNFNLCMDQLDSNLAYFQIYRKPSGGSEVRVGGFFSSSFMGGFWSSSNKRRMAVDARVVHLTAGDTIYVKVYNSRIRMRGENSSGPGNILNGFSAFLIQST